MKLIQHTKYLLVTFILIIQPLIAISSTKISDKNFDNAWDINPLKLQSLDGKKHSIDEWKGKVILLTFWATWCSPCIKEIRDFVKFQKHFVNNNLQIVSIGIDSKKNLLRVSKEMNINYPVLIADIEQKSGKEFVSLWENPQAFVPYSIAINSNGDIVYKHKGKLNTGLFDFYVRPLLKR